MIHVLNNLSEEYNVILDGIENHLTSSGYEVLTIEVICKKLNKEKSEKGTAFEAYNKQYKQRYLKCSKYVHKHS